MANMRKSTDGRKRARTMEYIDSQVDINDEETSQKNSHIGQHIEARIDLSLSTIEETSMNQSVSKVKKSRNSEQSFLSRQMSDITLNRFINETNKTTTGFKGRDHVLRLMKTTTNKPIIDLKNHKFIQDMINKRQEKQEVNRPISDFAFTYGLIDGTGKKSKSRKTSEFITDMAQQLEGLKSTLTRRKTVDDQSSLLRVVKLETVCNQLLCYCQYVTDKEDLVLFLDPNSEQTKALSINDQIRIGGESRIDMNLSELGSITLGITDIKKEMNENTEEDIPMEIVHTYDFNCLCKNCPSDNEKRSTTFDLRSTFQCQQNDHNEEIIYDSFTLALMSKRTFDLRATIIIFNPDKINNRYIFIVRDGIGNCLQIVLNDITGLHIEIQTKNYIFHQIEYFERIESPKQSNYWPYDDYNPPKKLFCFRSIHNQVSIL